MRIRLKPIDEQVMVITGADSGIGLATARAAAERGARLVINSRNEEELASIAADLRSELGAQVEWHACDVADPHAMLELAEVAIRAFGRIDTWINNAAVAIYGEIEQVPLDDARRLFETNYWGVVNGSLAALPYLKANGGALINVGSILSDRAIPLQGHYSATKHAVKAFTDALRMELEHQGAPVSVTLVKPGAIDTPYPEHAANYMDAEPRHPQPVYAPEVAADAILECAEHPRRSITIGGGGRMMAMMGLLTPRLADRYMEATLYRQQKRKEHGTLPQDEGLWSPSPLSGRTRGDQPGHVMKSSLYTKAALHPGRTVLVLGAFGLGFALVKTAGHLVGTVRERRALEDADVEVQVRGPGEGVPPTEERYAHAGLDPASGDGYRPDGGFGPYHARDADENGYGPGYI